MMLKWPKKMVMLIWMEILFMWSGVWITINRDGFFIRCLSPKHKLLNNNHKNSVRLCLNIIPFTYYNACRDTFEFFNPLLLLALSQTNSFPKRYPSQKLGMY